MSNGSVWFEPACMPSKRKAVLICSHFFKQNVGQDYLEAGYQHEMVQVGLSLLACLVSGKLAGSAHLFLGRM